jgi:protein Mpv17
MATLRQLFNAIKYPLVTVGRSYNEVAQKYPFQTGVITTVVKTSAADMFAQKVMQHKHVVAVSQAANDLVSQQPHMASCCPAGH